jgi:hypothetical protein
LRLGDQHSYHSKSSISHAASKDFYFQEHELLRDVFVSDGIYEGMDGEETPDSSSIPSGMNPSGSFFIVGHTRNFKRSRKYHVHKDDVLWFKMI